jgi:DNA polymerase-3 subunit delta'
MSVWDILAGSRAAETLAAQMASGEIAHAWLLLGPSGSGKKPAALAMACALNCSVHPGVGCGECPTCARILRQRHPDVHHVAPEGPLIPVDVIRELVVPEAARSPFEAGYKVFVIEEAQRMNDSAQNALLKTLEEPQPDTVFVLISGQEEELLETIRSRCRVVRLEPVSEERIVELLVKYGTSDDLARLAARISEGDYERARSFATDAGAAERRGVWAAIPDRLTSPAAAFDVAAELLDEVRAAVAAREDAQKQAVVELAEAMGEGRGTGTARSALAKRHKRELKRLEEDLIGEAFATLASFYRDILALRVGADAVTNVDLLDQIRDWATSDLSDSALLAAVERCLEVRPALARNANVPLQIEAALVHLARLVPPTPIVATG